MVYFCIMNYVGSVGFLVLELFFSEIIVVIYFIFTLNVHFYFNTVCRNTLFVDIDYGEIVQLIYENFVTYLFHQGSLFCCL